jgi:hypothetical protein
MYDVKRAGILQRRSPKQILIYPKFQLRLIAINITALLIAFTALIFQNYILFAKLHQMGTEAGLPAEHPFHQFINYEQNHFLFYTCGTLAGMLVIFIIASLIISHRVAGPIVRLKSFFISVRDSGKISQLQFRKDDFFDDLPEVINQSLESISKK